jgi:hypothetical protein
MPVERFSNGGSRRPHAMPPTRRSFKNPWDELDYLADKIGYWLYIRENRAAAMRFRDRFLRLLRPMRRKHPESIVLLEHLALFYSLLDDLPSEIRSREQLIASIRRLHEIGGPFDDRFGHDDLLQEMVILAANHFDNGEYAKARAVVEQAKRFADEHELPWEDEPLLQDCMQAERQREDRAGRSL